MGLWDRIQAAKGAPAPAPVETAPADKPASTQVWGRPGRCPQCNGRGYLDHIDLVDRVMYQHCTECRHEWVVHERDLETADAP